MKNQEIKADAGKPQLTLVPRQILFDIAQVREYGCKKYHSPDNWKKVEIERYRDAAFRHFMAYLDNPQGVDNESGLSHLKHLACYIAFLCELEKENGIVDPEYIYLSVTFGNGNKTYYYRTTDETITVGDKVKVPVPGGQRMGCVVEVEHYTKNDVPMAIEDVKPIIMHLIEKE